MNKLPRSIFVTIVLAFGTLFMFVLNPPHTKCDSQLNLFKEQYKGILYLDRKKPYMKTTEFKRVYEICRQGNTAGSCGSLYSVLSDLDRNLKAVSPECKEDVFSEKAVDSAIYETLYLFVAMAWGNKPPESYLDRSSWLDRSYLHLFCQLKDLAILARGKEKWQQWREEQLKALRGAEQLDRKQRWQRSLFSVPCSQI